MLYFDYRYKLFIIYYLSAGNSNKKIIIYAFLCGQTKSSVSSRIAMCGS